MAKIVSGLIHMELSTNNLKLSLILGSGFLFVILGLNVAAQEIVKTNGHQFAPLANNKPMQVQKTNITRECFEDQEENKSEFVSTSTTQPKDMVFVPGGIHLYGCNLDDKECVEERSKKIKLKNFWLDKTEVSVEQYKKCVEAKICNTTDLNINKYDSEWNQYCNWNKRQNHPLNCVSFHQAKTYCKWQGKRLPTERQWERAARGNEARIYPWGNTDYVALGKRAEAYANIADKQAKQAFNFEWAFELYDDGFAATSPVGFYTKGASLYGALDMVGNVSEWTSSQHTRGSSWDSSAKISQITHRRWELANSRDVSLGFRCIYIP